MLELVRRIAMLRIDLGGALEATAPSGLRRGSSVQTHSKEYPSRFMVVRYSVLVNVTPEAVTYSGYSASNP